MFKNTLNRNIKLSFGIGVILLMIVCNNYAQSAKIKFDQLTLKDGLSHGLVNHIIQDSRGYMWFATQDGLNRYDGFNFKIFKKDVEDSNSIGDNWVNSIDVDENGCIWAGTWDGGLCSYDYSEKEFTRYQHDPNDPASISSNQIQKIAVASDGKIYAATWDGGLAVLNKETGKFKNYMRDPDDPNSIQDNRVYSVFEDSEKNIWVGTNRAGMAKFDPETENFTNYKHDPDNPESINGNYVLAFAEDAEGYLWVATYDGGLNRFDKATETFTDYTNPDSESSRTIRANQVTSLLLDDRNELWVGTDGFGLYRYNFDTKEFSNYVHDPYDLGSLNTNRIWALSQDEAGIIWIGTFSGGVNKYDRNKNKFVHYKKYPGEKNSILNNYVKAITLDNEGLLWVGTYDGISVIDREKNEYTHYQSGDSEYSLSTNRIRSIIQDRKGRIWIATWGGGVSRFDKRTGLFKRYLFSHSNPASISEIYVKNAYEDKNGTIWFATEHGLNKYIEEIDGFTAYYHDPDDPQSISSNQIIVTYEDSFNNFWIGTTAGLNKMNRKTGTFINYQHDPDDTTSLSNNRVREIYQDTKGNLWIGTYGGGLNRFDYTTEKFHHIDKEEGLVNEVVYGILEDEQGYLWISTNKGISRMDYAKMEFKNYDVDDGLQENEFNGGAEFKSEDGEMFFGGVNGFNSFYPKNITDNPHIPPVLITDFRVYDKQVEFENGLNQKNEIVLNYFENFFSLSFAAMDFTAPEKNEYMYKLEGLEDEWIDAGNRNYVRYTNVPAGKYVFKVRGSNSDGVWNYDGESVVITITPPYWAEWWFQTLIALLILGSIFSYLRYKVKNVEIQKAVLENTVSERTKELAIAKEKVEVALVQTEMARKEAEEANKLKSELLAIAVHDLKNPLNVILGYTDIIKSELPKDSSSRELIQLVQKSSKDMLTIINQLLNSAKLETDTYKLELTKIDVCMAVRAVMDDFDVLAKQKHQIIKFDCADNLYIMGDEAKLREVLINLVSNAIKYSNYHKSVWVNAFEKDDKVCVEVIDEGPGFTDDDLKRMFGKFQRLSARPTGGESSTGLGLSIVKQIVDLHNGTIEVETKYGKGTKFKICLPKA